jgi:hypothetical protein
MNALLCAMLLLLIVVIRGGLQRHNIRVTYENRSTGSKDEIEGTHTGHGDLTNFRLLLRTEIRLINILYKYFARETHKYILLLIILFFSP